MKTGLHVRAAQVRPAPTLYRRVWDCGFSGRSRALVSNNGQLVATNLEVLDGLDLADPGGGGLAAAAALVATGRALGPLCLRLSPYTTRHRGGTRRPPKLVGRPMLPPAASVRPPRRRDSGRSINSLNRVCSGDGPDDDLFHEPDAQPKASLPVSPSRGHPTFATTLQGGCPY